MPFLKILVVENYEPFRRRICLSLQQRPGFQVIKASNGLEAVQKAKELRPDLILIDIGLPKLNGIEAAKRIRRLAPQAKLLFVSQESDPDVVQETFRLGARGYVHKPLALSDLLPAIDAVLVGKRFVSSGLEFNEGADAHHRHEVQFYSDDSVFFESTTRFVTDALMAADAAIVLATNSHREGLVQKLKADDAAISLEKIGNDLVKAHNVEILCAYPLPDGQEDDEALKSICAEHTAVYWR
jgi:DNA-binding NarL/FixJ family response regulator